MSEARAEYVTIATASNQSEAIKVQMLLDRTRLPYRVLHENLYSIYGDAAAAFAGPMQFMIPKELKAQAEATLLELFDVASAELPACCPACDARVPKGSVDCPACGLFLG
jgi:hypothetical protein